MANSAVTQQVEDSPLAEWAHLRANQHCSLTVDVVGVHRWADPNGNLHRVDENGIQDGPACSSPNGYQIWCINDKIHRLDGPGFIWADGTPEWWIEGNPLTQEERSSDPRVIELHSQTPEEAESWLIRL